MLWLIFSQIQQAPAWSQLQKSRKIPVRTIFLSYQDVFLSFFFEPLLWRGKSECLVQGQYTALYLCPPVHLRIKCRGLTLQHQGFSWTEIHFGQNVRAAPILFGHLEIF